MTNYWKLILKMKNMSSNLSPLNFLNVVERYEYFQLELPTADD